LSRIVRTIALLFIMLYLPSQTLNAAGEAYYMWIDENGVTNFGQKDPKEYESVYVRSSNHDVRLNRPRLPKPDPKETPASRKQEVDPDIEIQDERDDIKEQIAKIRASNCQIGKRNLAKLEAYARIRVRGDDGEERVISEEEKQDRTAKARKTVTENCGRG
jgi:hypothetical protein